MFVHPLFPFFPFLLGLVYPNGLELLWQFAFFCIVSAGSTFAINTYPVSFLILNRCLKATLLCHQMGMLRKPRNLWVDKDHHVKPHVLRIVFSILGALDA